MDMKHVEIELKFPLLNHKELKEKLDSIAKPGKQNDVQKDVYFNPPHRDFLSKKLVSEWLRLRESKKGSSLNYKNWHKEIDPKSVSCDEFETKIDNTVSLRKLLESLDFRELVTVEKNRSTWNYKDTEIAIDEVRDLGTFIEIEAKRSFANIEEAKKRLYMILEEIGAEVGPQDFDGYPYMLMKKKNLL